MYYLLSWCSSMDQSVKHRIPYLVIQFQSRIESFVSREISNFCFVKSWQERRPKQALQPKTWLLHAAVGRVVSTLRTCWLLLPQRVSVTTSTTRRGASQLSDTVWLFMVHRCTELSKLTSTRFADLDVFLGQFSFRLQSLQMALVYLLYIQCDWI